MSTVPIAELPKEQREELMCVYASLILHDDGLDISQENILKLIKSAKGDIQPFTPMLFARALKGKDLSTLFSSVAAGGTAAAPAGSAPPAAASPEAKKEEPEAEEEEDDMGFSLFD
ncbi:60S acidic ribosomal protein P1, putative [Theileria equi strain WA]|uniref:60S acidic ribosomal protein P1, putative n=1 Tax=Theileria equi strain WA TaxID=1537102 RepID=L0B229_THEEQ|nr:60S acidic ribosomal protein P1, putative [Theileria equi strain WA]AFZ81553.1 60S acidic ribosomal protein P1, putative [Theileria equi strain WA]|eukprot:XP_004831219.1 60S acidic ribosomal protein P1, putative [Theileria equi strain WA]